MGTFKHIGEYKCICGREFTNSQSYNGHLARCKIYQQQKRGDDYESWAADYKSKLDKAAQEQGQQRLLESEERKKQEEKNWVSEGHYCEKCGKLMDHKYGSGRFCSQICANRYTSNEFANNIEAKFKKSNKVRLQHGNLPITFEQYLESGERKKNRKKRVSKEETNQYLSDILPQVEKGANKKGWQPRNIRWSYPEKFWKQVFENNNVDYIHGEYVHNEKAGLGAAVYELDFLIDGKYDIEIDGSLHEKFEDVKKKDIRRDAYLTSLGYIVYRIPWINPVSIEKKDLVYQQIVDLFNFLGKELITKKD